ncbi:MAG: insulinase family protein [Oscillospiraceae bacterium]|nr:insulinase family protein [Oscillospiraceae bacterium]
MIQTLSLAPGITLRGCSDGRFKQSVLSIQFVRPMCREEASQNALIPAVLLRGCEAYPDLRAITARLDDLYGAGISALVRRIGDYQTTGLSCAFIADRFAMAGDQILVPMVQLLRQLFLEPVRQGDGFSEAFVESEKKNLISTLEAERNDKRAYAGAQLLRTMCQKDSFGIPRLGTIQSVAAIDPVSLMTHYQKILKESPVEIFYAGGAHLSQVAGVLAPLFSGMDRRYVNLPGQTPFQDLPTQTLRTEELEVAQAKLCMGFVTPITNRHEDFAAMQVFNALFGSGQSCKLFQTVREKLSLCYSIGSGYYSSKGIVTVSAGIDSRNMEKTRDQILALLQDCREGRITEEELEAAKLSLISGLRTVHDSPGAMEGYYASAALSGLSLTPEAYIAAVEAVAARDVAAAAGTVQLHTTYFLKEVGSC